MNNKMFNFRKLKEARKNGAFVMSRKGLRGELADRGISISEVTLWRWERGENAPPADILGIIAHITDKPIEFFFEAA